MTRTPIHPGEILKEELNELEMTCSELASKLKIPANRVSQIVACKRSISADTALRLGKWFGTGPEFWLNLQKSYELDRAKITIEIELKNITPLSVA